jgi:hypothetical protein
MPLLYKLYGGENNLVFWNPYFSVIFAPEKVIDNRYFSAKIMVTIGRELKQNIDKEQIDKLPKKFKEKFNKEIGSSLTESLIKFLKGIYKKSLKLLGSKVEVDEKKFQIFEYMKYDFTAEDKEKYENMLYGMAIGYGMICSAIGLVKSEMMERILKIMNNGIEVGMKKWQMYR